MRTNEDGVDRWDGLLIDGWDGLGVGCCLPEPTFPL